VIAAEGPEAHKTLSQLPRTHPMWWGKAAVLTVRKSFPPVRMCVLGQESDIGHMDLGLVTRSSAREVALDGLMLVSTVFGSSTKPLWFGVSWLYESH
jgi:hypothetical protein